MISVKLLYFQGIIRQITSVLSQGVPVKVRIIKCCSQDKEGLLPARIRELQSHGLDVLFQDIAFDSSWPYTAGSFSERSAALCSALLDNDCPTIICARGGYGAANDSL
jgi:muramoyltetrapeptide carboxypeptidase LdcA involved in peptidoglycan recycling